MSQDAMYTTQLSTSSTYNIPTFLMEDNFSIAMIIVTLALAIVAITLNFGVMNFNKKDAKTKTISFIYFILSFSDFCTGVCALLHTLIFAVVMARKGHMTEHVTWLVEPANFITAVAFKVSAFVSVNFAVIRTINILQPFHVVNMRAVVMVTAVYAALWSCVYLVDVAIFVKQWNKGGVVERLMSRFYNPSKSYLVEFIIRKYNVSYIKMECVGDCLYTITPVFLCAAISLIVTVIQLVHLWLPGQDPNQSGHQTLRRGVTVTIIMITLLFISCAGVTLYGPHRVCAYPTQITDRRIFYAAGYLPFFINAALNPIILVIRISALRSYLLKNIVGVQPYSSPLRIQTVSFQIRQMKAKNYQ